VKGNLLAMKSSAFSLAAFLLALLSCAPVWLHRDAFAQSSASEAHLSWRNYGGAPDSSQYSSLDQINRTNVGRLQIAWKFPTGDGNNYLFNPIVIDGGRQSCVIICSDIGRAFIGRAFLAGPAVRFRTISLVCL
jgi:hypothetical protein